MARHSDRKPTASPRVSKPSDPSRRNFIERMVGTSVAAPALLTLTGSWLAADVHAQVSSESSISGSTKPSKGSKPQSESSIGSSGSSTSGPPSIAHAAADSTLRSDAPNTNEGANPRIRVSVRPVRRGIVQFDPVTVAQMKDAAAQGGTVYMTLDIAGNNNNWSQDEEHYVDVHALPENFWVPEGDGKVTGMAPDEVYRGSVPGVTWNLPYDANTFDAKKKATKGLPAQWEGGDVYMLPATAPGQLHGNGLTGQVSWDVTQDVLSGANAWIVKVRNEDEPVQSPERRQAGFDPYRGAVDYYSKEGALDSIGCAFPPKLQLYQFNYCASPEGEQSQSYQGPVLGSQTQ